MPVFVKALKAMMKKVIINTKYERLENMECILLKSDYVKC